MYVADQVSRNRIYVDNVYIYIYMAGRGRRGREGGRENGRERERERENRTHFSDEMPTSGRYAKGARTRARGYRGASGWTPEADAKRLARAVEARVVWGTQWLPMLTVSLVRFK